MPKPISFGRFEVGLAAGSQPEDESAESESPMRILILGDFSAHQSRERQRPGLAERRPIVVDRDNLDQVMAKVGVELHFSANTCGDGLTIGFRELEDFHPDRLYQRVELFQALRDLRSRLSDPSTFTAASEQGYYR